MRSACALSVHLEDISALTGLRRIHAPDSALGLRNEQGEVLPGQRVGVNRTDAVFFNRQTQAGHAAVNVFNARRFFDKETHSKSPAQRGAFFVEALRGLRKSVSRLRPLKGPLPACNTAAGIDHPENQAVANFIRGETRNTDAGRRADVARAIERELETP